MAGLQARPFSDELAAEEAERGERCQFPQQLGAGDRRQAVMRPRLAAGAEEILMGRHLLGPPVAIGQRRGTAAIDIGHAVDAPDRGKDGPETVIVTADGGKVPHTQ